MTLDTFVHYDINFYAALLLVSVLAIMRWRRSAGGYSAKLFRALLLSNLLMVLLEVLSWVFDGGQGPLDRYLNHVLNWTYLWLNPLMLCLWASYIDYTVFRSVARLRRRLFYFHPMIVSTVMMVINLFAPIVYAIDDANVYSRGPALWIPVGAAFAMLLFVVFMAWLSRARLRDGMVPMIILFLTAPAIASVAQMLVYGAMLIWSTMALVLAVSYIVLETITASRDYLTGLSSRLRVEEFVRHLIDSRSRFGLVVIDLDDFKLINDSYGHQSGDEALILFAETLNDVFAGERMIARFGGDEFVIVTSNADQERLDEYKRVLARRVELLNVDANRPYRIRMSYGATVVDPSCGDTLESAFSRADALMYADKATNKNLRRRAEDRAPLPRE